MLADVFDFFVTSHRSHARVQTREVGASQKSAPRFVLSKYVGVVDGTIGQNFYASHGTELVLRSSSPAFSLFIHDCFFCATPEQHHQRRGSETLLQHSILSSPRVCLCSNANLPINTHVPF